MNTYILHADLHQELLTQKRIDPITGDSIQESDEVVFCASCKSIFLKDTWEYLGEKHCNQSQTLNYIPSHSINLKLGDDILFHIPVAVNSEEIKISSKVGNWIYKESNTGKYHKYFFGEEEELSVKTLFAIFVSVLFSGLSIGFQNLLFLIAIALILLPYPLTKYLKARNYGKKLTDGYRKITRKSLLIKTNGISICSAYGITEVFLHLKHLRAIIVSDVSYSRKVIIFEYDNKKKLTIPININTYYVNEESFNSLLKALGKMSQNLDFPITFYMRNKDKIEIINQLITEKNAKFTITIETKREYLKKKYRYLYKRTDKNQKILS